MPTKTKNLTGWKPLRAIDLRSTGSEPGYCQRCGRKDFRYQHIVFHPIEGEMRVGCECAKRLCYGYQPEREERKLRNLWSRRSRWLTRNWATSRKGNHTLKFKVDDEMVYVTVSDDAKLSAFDIIATAADW